MIYQQTPRLDVLEQGDLLRRSPEVVALLEKYHPYYANHPQNVFFAVLTQSCDLVRRGERCAARYISLAPVRPLRAILRREFEGTLHNVGPGRQPFGSHRTRTTIEQFLERLFRNNEPPFFFYEPAHAAGVAEEMCAMLALPVSLKPEHYETLLKAKLVGVEDVFQAKLGWLLGQMYSRVGTPDFDTPVISKMVRAYMDGAALWLEDGEVKSLVEEVVAHDAMPNAPPLGAKELGTMIAKLPKRKSLVIDAVLDAAARIGLFEPVSPERRRFRLELERDPAFANQLARK